MEAGPLYVLASRPAHTQAGDSLNSSTNLHRWNLAQAFGGYRPMVVGFLNKLWSIATFLVLETVWKPNDSSIWLGNPQFEPSGEKNVASGTAPVTLTQVLR